MNTISIKYALKWRHKTMHHYQWSECGKLFNTNTGRLIKKTINGGSVGYWLPGGFTTLQKLRSKIEIIPREKAPF